MLALLIVTAVVALAALAGVIVVGGRARRAAHDAAAASAKTGRRLDRLADSLARIRDAVAETDDRVAAIAARLDAAAARPVAPDVLASPPPPDPADAYRAMAGTATHSGFVAWAAAFGAQGADVGADGVIRANHDLANAATAIVAGSTGAWLFPGASVVADFATRFHDVLTLQDVLGSAFALETGGGGRLRLVAPATLTATAAGEWRIASPGRIDGLSG